MTFVITRDQLVAAIESGIIGAPRLTDDERVKLWRLGATAKRIAVGTYFSTEGRCGCPLRRAFNMRGDVISLPNTREWDIESFTAGYDAYLSGIWHAARAAGERWAPVPSYVRVTA